MALTLTIIGYLVLVVISAAILKTYDEGFSTTEALILSIFVSGLVVTIELTRISFKFLGFIVDVLATLFRRI